MKIVLEFFDENHHPVDDDLIRPWTQYTGSVVAFSVCPNTDPEDDSEDELRLVMGVLSHQVHPPEPEPEPVPETPAQKLRRQLDEADRAARLPGTIGGAPDLMEALQESVDKAKADRATRRSGA